MSVDGEADCFSNEVAFLLKFRIDKIYEIDFLERGKTSIFMNLDKHSKVMWIPRSGVRFILRLGVEESVLNTNLGVIWMLSRPSWCPNPQADKNSNFTEKVRLRPEKVSSGSNILLKLIRPHQATQVEMVGKSKSENELDLRTCLKMRVEDG